MPIHEYLCTKCGHRFEKIQRFSDAPIKTCPKCKGKVEQLLSAPAAHFKGTGWYATDYPKKGAGGAKEKSDDSSAKKVEAGAESKSETKSESKPKAAEKGDKK